MLAAVIKTLSPMPLASHTAKYPMTAVWHRALAKYVA